MTNDFINWDEITKMSQADPSYENIVKLLTSNQGSYRDIAGKEIMPLLEAGTDPYLQQAIAEIVRQGKESKARTMADVGTTAQSRGLTGSSIESGDIAQASYQQELGQQGQITGMLAQDAAARKQQMLQFLTTTYDMDFERANQISDMLAQAMGQEMGRRQDLDMFNRALKASKRKRSGIMQPILGAAGGVVGTIYGGPAGGVAGSAIGSSVGSLFDR